MRFDYLVLGAGRQGAALAYDLALNGEARRVTLADSDERAARAAVARLETLLGVGRCELIARRCDVAVPADVADTIRGAAVVISAVPYVFNVQLTDAAIAAGAHFCDLGGNTAVVREQLARHERAAAAGVSVLPDCGLAPGLGNIVAAYGVSQLDAPRDVHVRCGGLPERPVGPLGYKMLFNFQGLVNEYSGCAEFLRDGRRVEVPTLTEIEPIEFPPPVGRCEAAVTSGGTSTCPQSFEGRLENYDYKTVRYPEHWAVIRAMFELGCFEESLRLADGSTIEPKALMRRLFEEQLAFPEVRDVTVLRITVRGRDKGAARTLQFDLLDRHDERTGFTAMERTTAFPTALAAHLQARGLVAPGARPLERSIPLQAYMDELPRHDIRLAVTQR